MTAPKIEVGDWVLICETSEKGCVIDVFDKGERFLLNVQQTNGWPFPKRVHVTIEKIRKIKTPRPEKPQIDWSQESLF